MAENFFDQFDEASPAAKPRTAAPAADANFFDQFDEGAATPKAAGSATNRAVAGTTGAIIEGIPVAGPILRAGADKAAAFARSVTGGKPYVDELAEIEGRNQQFKEDHPYVDTGAQIVGGVLGTAPMIAAAPALFGAGAGSLGARTAASALSGGLIGVADSAVRSEGDVGETLKGGGIGAGFGLAGPVAGKAIGKGVSLFTGRGRGEAVVREAIEGFSDAELASAQHIQERARALPGGGVELSLDEALNLATEGRAGPLAQLNRVVTNSGGEGGRTMAEFYSKRPASVDNVGRTAFNGIAEPNLNPTAVGFDVQDAARAGVGQTPQGQALARSRAEQAPRITPEQAGRAIQDDLAGVRGLREAARSSRANVDYRLAREAPENVGVERTVTVERPGEPVLQTLDNGSARGPDYLPPPQGPHTLQSVAPKRPDISTDTSSSGPSLWTFMSENGGIGLERGDVKAAGLDRYRRPGVANLVRENGKSIDNHWREALIEKGYLPPDADGGMARNVHDEVLSLLEQEARGRSVRPYWWQGDDAASGFGRVSDEFEAAAGTATRDVRKALEGAGVDPKGVHRDILDRAAAALVSGAERDPLKAYEGAVMAMREPVSRGPTSRMVPTTVTEEIPDVRFGQVNPQAAVDALDRQVRSAKGDVRATLEGIRRDLYEHGTDPASGVRETDMSVEGLLHARERLDQHIQTALKDGDGTKVRDLQIVRSQLDGRLKDVPEVAAADANFARNSVPLAPFERPNSPLGRITDRVEQPGREPGPFRMPAEQVPEAVTGPTALRETLANGGPATRTAAEGRLSTRILDQVTGADGDVSAEALRTAMRTHADELDQMPALRDRLSRLVMTRESMARIEASPLGRIAERPDVKKAISTLFPADPLPNSQAEIGAAVQAVSRNSPGAARDLVRIYLEGVFNEATQNLRGGAAAYGGAGFAATIRGNAQQRHNLEAAVRALPDGATIWGGLDNLLGTLEATGYRPVKGSDTSFNNAFMQRMKDGAGPVGKIVTETIAGAAAGAGAGGPAGAVGGAWLAGRRAAGDAYTQARMLGDNAAVARILTDPRALPHLRSLSRAEPGSRSAELLTTRILVLANEGRQSGSAR